MNLNINNQNGQILYYIKIIKYIIKTCNIFNPLNPKIKKKKIEFDANIINWNSIILI